MSLHTKICLCVLYRAIAVVFVLFFITLKMFFLSDQSVKTFCCALVFLWSQFMLGSFSALPRPNDCMRIYEGLGLGLDIL